MAKSEHYLKPKEFLAEILLSKEQDKLTRNAEKMLIKLGNKVIMKMRYYNPGDREDCLQTGLLQILTNWRSFNPERSNNAFAYFTEIFKRGIAKGWGELYHHKGDPEHTSKTLSLSSSNDGDGIFNL